LEAGISLNCGFHESKVNHVLIKLRPAGNSTCLPYLKSIHVEVEPSENTAPTQALNVNV
jgi:hypothetical protein